MMTTQPRPRSAFEKWLHENHLTNAAAGKLLGCSGEMVRLIAQGERLPGDELGRRILDALLSHDLPVRSVPGIAPDGNSPSAIVSPEAAEGALSEDAA